MVAPRPQQQPSPAYQLDASVCIELLRAQSPIASLRVPLSECVLSSVVEAELWVGVYKHANPAARRADLSEFLDLFSILAFDSAAAHHYGEIRAELEKQGRKIGPNDLLIAAHARSMDATLVTANAGEFRRVKGLKVLAWR